MFFGGKINYKLVLNQFINFLNASLDILFAIAAKSMQKTLARCKPNELSFQNEGLSISPPTPQYCGDPISVRSNWLLRIYGVSGRASGDCNQVKWKKSPLSKNWRGAGGEKTLVVRPWLHCPEIDSYDEISLKQVIGTFEDKNKLEISDKIVYTV